MTMDITFAPGVDIVRSIDSWESEGLMARLWEKDPTVWFDPPRPEIGNRLGWLDLPTTSIALVDQIDELALAARDGGITDLVLCGMGGSSLAPEVFAATVPTADGAPALTVIDSTHPGAVQAVAEATNPSTTWYLVSSKSGGTLETMSLFRFFWASAVEELDDPGAHFIAVTDPGSSLEALAAERGFRATVLADPNVGGRYSALSAFGLVPAGIIGADVRRLLASAGAAAAACGPAIPVAQNPAFALGALLGESALGGTTVAYFSATAPVERLPIWAEQLIAESTGKEGKGIIPVDGGAIPASGSAVVIAVGAALDPDADVSIVLDDPHAIAGAMFVLELATAVAGQVLGIQPFDQPDVQLAKTLAHDAMAGNLPAASVPLLDAASDDAVRSFAESISEGAVYASIHAYVPATSETNESLETLARVITEATGLFTTIGYGPRFLHSTGQLHKGGPATGVFLQIVDSPSVGLHVPESDFTFDELVAGQAQGDLAALVSRDRPVTAVSVEGDPAHAIVDFTERLAQRLG